MFDAISRGRRRWRQAGDRRGTGDVPPARPRAGPSRGRHQAWRSYLDPRRRRGPSGAGDPRVHPVPKERPVRRRRPRTLRILRCARVRRGASRHPRLGGLRRRADRRVHRPGAGRRRRSHRLDRLPAVVQRRGRDDRQILGRVQRPPGRGAAPARPPSCRHRVLDRRPLRRRRPLHGRLSAHRRDARMGHQHARGGDASSRSQVGRRGLEDDVAGASRGVPSPGPHVAHPPASGRLLEARLGERGLRRHQLRRVRDRRVVRRIPGPGVQAHGGSHLPEEGAHRAVVAPVSDGLRAWAAYRVLAGMHAFLRPVAEGRGDGDHGRADAPGLDPGPGAAGDPLRRAPRPLGCRALVAVSERHGSGLVPERRPPR